MLQLKQGFFPDSSGAKIVEMIKSNNLDVSLKYIFFIISSMIVSISLCYSLLNRMLFSCFTEIIFAEGINSITFQHGEEDFG